MSRTHYPNQGFARTYSNIAYEFGKSLKESADKRRKGKEEMYKKMALEGGTSRNNNKKMKLEAKDVMNEDGAMNVIAVAKGVVHKKGVKEKKKKIPHVSAAFKHKVEGALKSKSVTGTKTDISYGSMSDLTNTTTTYVAENNWIDPINYTSGTVSTPMSNKWDFSPEYFLDAASCLFGSKPHNGPTSTNLVWWNPTNMGYVDATHPTSEVKFNIVDSNVKYMYRNISTKVVKIKLYDCAPKKSSCVATANYDITNTLTTVADAIVSPSYTWFKAAADEVTQGILPTNSELVVTAATVGYRTALTNTPTSFVAFNTNFKVNCIEIILEPGATYTHHVQGPSQYEWNSTGQVKNGIFQTIAKYSRYSMPVVSTDLIVDAYATIGGACGGRGPWVTTSTNNLVVEKVSFCKIEMPETTGFIYPAGAYTPGNIQENTLRTRKRLCRTWYHLGTGTHSYNTALRQTEVIAAQT